MSSGRDGKGTEGKGRTPPCPPAVHSMAQHPSQLHSRGSGGAHRPAKPCGTQPGDAATCHLDLRADLPRLWMAQPGEPTRSSSLPISSRGAALPGTH